jgi:hypothetical protein
MFQPIDCTLILPRPFSVSMMLLRMLSCGCVSVIDLNDRLSFYSPLEQVFTFDFLKAPHAQE